MVQHIEDDPPGALGEMLQEHGIPFDTINLEEGETLPAELRYDAMIVLGGPEYAGDDEVYPYLAPEKALIREAVARDVPFLGVCLGGQLLAHAMGGRVIRNGLFEMGFFQEQLTEEGKDDSLFRGLPGYQQVFNWHSDAFEVPEGGTLLAIGPDGSKQAFRVGRCAYGFQYHIELTPHMFATWTHFHPYRQENIERIGRERFLDVVVDFTAYYPLYLEHTRIIFENFLHFLSPGEL
jgi:GMP synthase (glutamine-hydrolysing)